MSDLERIKRERDETSERWADGHQPDGVDALRLKDQVDELIAMVEKLLSTDMGSNFYQEWLTAAEERDQARAEVTRLQDEWVKENKRRLDAEDNFDQARADVKKLRSSLEHDHRPGYPSQPDNCNICKSLAETDREEYR